MLTSKLKDITKTSEILNKGSNILEENVEEEKKLRLKTSVELLEEIQIEEKKVKNSSNNRV